MEFVDEKGGGPGVLAKKATAKEAAATGVPIENYFRHGEADCAELEALPVLRSRLREILGIA